jgi:hypothetical protein
MIFPLWETQGLTAPLPYLLKILGIVELHAFLRKPLTHRN